MQEVEGFITEELKKYSPFEAGLAEVKDICLEAKVSGVNDLEGYKNCDDLRKKVKKIRTSIEAKRKEIKAVSLKFGYAVDDEATRLKGLVAPIEDHLVAQCKIVEDEEKRIAEEAERKEREAAAERKRKEEEDEAKRKKELDDKARELDEKEKELKRREAALLAKDQDAPKLVDSNGKNVEEIVSDLINEDVDLSGDISLDLDLDTAPDLEPDVVVEEPSEKLIVNPNPIAGRRAYTCNACSGECLLTTTALPRACINVFAASEWTEKKI